MRGLAGRLHYDASNLTNPVDRLEARGVVERHALPGDRRVKALRLTAAGRRLRTGSGTTWSKTQARSRRCLAPRYPC
jgi:DNA-binding MarR family transcriptional regulator